MTRPQAWGRRRHRGWKKQRKGPPEPPGPPEETWPGWPPGFELLASRIVTEYLFLKPLSLGSFLAEAPGNKHSLGQPSPPHGGDPSRPCRPAQARPAPQGAHWTAALRL